MASNDWNRQGGDPLFRTIIGTTSLLGVLFGALMVYWGAGPVLFEAPWYIPTTHSFAGLAAFSVAFLALGRYAVLRDPAAYWIGLAFAAFGILSVFFILAWPGLLPGGAGLIAQLPNTSGWIALLELTSITVLLLAAVLVPWPGEQALARRRWLGSVGSWLLLVTLVASLSVLFEAYLPQLIGPQGHPTPLLLSWDWLFLVLFAGGAVLSTHRYRHSGDKLLGYVALTQIVLAFVVLSALIAARHYDLWYYLGRLLLVGGFLPMMVGLLTESARQVLARSEQRYRTLINSIDAGFCVIEMIFDENDKPLDYRFLEVTATFEQQTGLVNAEGKRMRELAPQHEAHWFDIYGQIALTGTPRRFENPAKALNRWYEVYAYRYGQPEDRQVAILFNDITERRWVEEALRRSEERFAKAFQTSPDVLSSAGKPTVKFWR